MRKFLFLSSLFIFLASALTVVNAQSDVGIKANFAGGEIISLSSEKIELKTKDGVITVMLSPTTQFKRIPSGNPSLKSAIDSTFSEIVVGDNLLVTGMVTSDKSKIPAKAVYLISKSDIAARLAKENAEWSTRGMNGKVVSVNRIANQIVVSTRTVVGETKTTVSPKEKAVFHRYAPDSIKFSEAVVSEIGEIQIGDMFRALGDKGENNTFQAEEIITGAFSTTAGTITAIDIEKNEVTVMDIQSKILVTVSLKDTSIVKQFPAEVAQRLAMMQMMAASGEGTQPGQGTRPPQGTGQGQEARPGGGNGQGGGARPGGGRGGSIDEMLEGFPNIGVKDLKVGEMIAVSSSKTADPTRITAIKLLAGVEPFLKAPQMAAGRGGRGGQGGGQNTGVSIPGLDDGFGIP